MAPSLTFRVLAWLDAHLGPPTETLSPEASRVAFRKTMQGPAFLVGRRAKGVRVEDGRSGGVPVRRYFPSTAPQPGRIVYFHGGVFVRGDLETHDACVSAMAAATRREVVAVDYRLAPEHPFPAAVDDGLAVLRAEGDGPLVVMGDSAGGCLAAVMAQTRSPSIVAQVLLCPMIDLASERPSYERFATGHLLTRETLRISRALYVPNEAQRVDPRCSPIRAESVAGVAPAYVLLAESDVLHDEGRAYADRLREGGVPVQLDVVSGTLHGFTVLAGLRVSRDAVARVASWLDAVAVRTSR